MCHRLSLSFYIYYIYIYIIHVTDTVFTHIHICPCMCVNTVSVIHIIKIVMPVFTCAYLDLYYVNKIQGKLHSKM